MGRRLCFLVWVSCVVGGQAVFFAPTCSQGRQSGLLIRSELPNNYQSCLITKPQLNLLHLNATPSPSPTLSCCQDGKKNPLAGVQWMGLVFRDLLLSEEQVQLSFIF